MSTAGATPGKKLSEKEQQEIVGHFNRLREEQRMIAVKAAELQNEQKSHELVIEALKEVEKERKCYRMIGGVLVERTVNEVLPALAQNREQLTKLIDNLQAQLVSKGKELNEYREKYNIRLQNEIQSGDKSKASNEQTGSQTSKKSSGVLVE